MNETRPQRVRVAAGARALLAFAALTLAVAADPNPAPNAPEVQVLDWSVKLLYRGRYLMKQIGVDQWSGARIAFTGYEDARGRTTYSMLRPLEDPWVFRWYPSKSELKLGATISVAAEEVAGDAYETLAARAAPKAKRLAQAWTTDPLWEACRARDTRSPRLSDPPTYPFFVLGSPKDRLRFRVEETGAIDTSAGIERMSRPWLADGWSRALAGEEPVGIGYWARKRPDWEPHGYPALFESLAWFERVDPATGATGIELRTLAKVLQTLNPQIGDRLGWDERIEWTGTDSGERIVLDGSLRVRFRRTRVGSGIHASDEILATIEDSVDGCRMRLEARLAYAPFDPDAATADSSPETNSRSSSRRRR